MRINQQIRDALSNNRSKEEIRGLVYGSGNVITMLQDGLEKVVEGYTTFEEILKLIELEDDDKISSNSSLSEAIMETKEALAAQEQQEGKYIGIREELVNNGQNVLTPNSNFQNVSPINSNLDNNVQENVASNLSTQQDINQQNMTYNVPNIESLDI